MALNIAMASILQCGIIVSYGYQWRNKYNIRRNQCSIRKLAISG